MATLQSHFIIGAFQTEREAKNAIDALKNAGFAHDQIGIALREGGTVTRSLLNDFMNLGIPQNEASYYDDEFKAGHPVVSVRADGRDQEVMDLLRGYGAYTYAMQRPPAAGMAGMAASQGTAYETDEAQRLKLREEQLQVEKERVQTGEVHLRKEVVAEQQTFTVPTTREEIVVEVQPGSGLATDQSPIAPGETVHVPVSEERIHVTKQPVETGEVSIHKEAVQEERPVSETVRHEKARLEQEGQPRIRTNEPLENP
jgi:uncharacterized protein (TIGR02271 family)